MNDQKSDAFNNAGIYCREAKECYLCGAVGRVVHKNLSDRLYGVSGKWNIMACPACGLDWLNPRPLSKDAWKLYQSYYTHAKKKYPDFLYDIDRGLTCKAFNYESAQRKGAGYRIGQVLSFLGVIKEWAGSRVMWLNGPAGGSLLDVGCGSGSFLKRMSNFGWDTVGLETDQKAANIAQKTTGAKVIATTLECAGLSPASFNAITMNHVLEHFVDPVEELRTCKTLLKKRGKLVIATPNAKSLGQKIFGADWRGYDIPRHMFIFSQDSLLDCIRKAGLKPAKSMTIATSAWETWTVSRLAQTRLLTPERSRKMQLKGEGLAFWLFEYFANRLINCGEQMIAVAVHGDTEESGR